MNEDAVDLTFTDLPPQAQDEANKLFDLVKNLDNPIQHFVRELDRSIVFRRAIGVTNDDILPHQVDCVIRHFRGLE